MEWQLIGPDIHGLVNDEGKILAEVHPTLRYGIYAFEGVKYISLQAAKKAAERATTQEE